MKTNINPELWNSLTEVQKRALAENILVEKPALLADADERAALLGTLGALIIVVAFAAILLR